MQPRDPVFMGIIGISRQAVDRPIFGGPALVSKAVPQVDRDRGHLANLLKTGCRGFRKPAAFGCPILIHWICHARSASRTVPAPYDSAAPSLRRCGLGWVVNFV